MKSLSTTNTYEATFYLISGATLDSVSFSRTAENKRQKLGYAITYRLYLTNVKEKCIKQWAESRAIVNVRQFADERKKLKRKIAKVQRGEL